MKKIFKKFGLSLAAMACVVCAGFGVALGFSKDVPTAKAATITELPDSDYYIASAGLRLINDADGAALRFNTNLIADQYDNVVESGTLIIPEVRYDGQLTLDDLNNAAKYQPAHVVTKGKVNGKDVDLWYDFGEVGGDTFKRTTAYLYDIPEVWYGARMIAVSYIKDANGNIKYTTVLDEVDGVRMNRYSMSDVASRFANSAEYADRVAPYIVDEVTVTYAMPDGSKQTETVAYGSKVSGPTYLKDTYAIASATDSYGSAVNLANYEATLPVTIDVELEAAKVVVADSAVIDSSNAYLTLSNNAVGVTAPAGFSRVTNLFSAKGNSWGAYMDGDVQKYSRILSSGDFANTDLSAYSEVWFAIAITGGHFTNTADNWKNLDSDNELVWVKFHMMQTSSDVWSVSIYVGDALYNTFENRPGDTIYKLIENNNNGLRLVIYQQSDGTQSTADTNIYATEVIGRPDLPVFDPAIPEDAAILWNHVWQDYCFTGGSNPEGAYAEDVAAPKGFNYVNYYSWTSTTSNDFPKMGHLNDSDISAYSDLWFAMKVENGLDIYVQGGALYTGGDWLYVHMAQAGDGTWTKTFSSPDGYSATQTGLTDTAFTALLQYKSGVNRGSYPRHKMNSGVTTTAYFTDVLAIRKDGNAIVSPTPPAHTIKPEDFDPEIPDNAVPVRSYVWIDDRYTDSAQKNCELLTEGAPDGFTSVLKHVWKENRTSEYTYCFDTTLDITKFSDLYLATKMENGTHIYVKNSGGHYAAGGWLYAHYTQVSTGVWKVSYRAADGYSKDIAQTISATNIKTLIDGNLYGHAASAGMGTITYWTEILGVSAVQGERAIWSAVDKAVPTDDAIGVPVGFTSLYKYVGFAKTNGKSNFAALDLSNTVYEELSFGMLANKDFTFNEGYKYTMPGEAEERPTTSIMYNTSSYPQMYKVNLTNNHNGSWTVTMNVKRWVSAPASGGSSAQIPDTETFTATVTGNSIQEIMDKVLSPSSNMTLYVTEVRGSHTCKYGYTDSLGDGYLQDYCACGEKIGDMYPFAHGIDAEATEVNDSIWRDDNYALSTPDQVAPVGFKKIEMYDWLHNTTMVDDKTGTGNMIPYGSNANDMPLTCLDEALIEGYKEVYFAIKLVGGDGIFVGNGGEYFGNDWLYVHYSKDMNTSTWSLSVRAADGTYTKENVQTGISVQLERLDKLMEWGYLGADNSGRKGLYPTKTAENTVAKVYFTEILGVIACEHTTYEWKNNEYACANCGEVVGAVNTSLEKQTFVLYENATLAEEDFDPTEDHNITITGIIKKGTFENVAVNSVEINGEEYSTIFENGSLTISGIKAKDVFGEYTLELKITIEGKEFTITAPILVVTDLITTNEGLLNVRKILRGADSTTSTKTVTYGDTEYREFGGKGGEGTMNGDGYYMLGANITMSEIIIGEHNTENYSKQTTYVFGTLTVPFVGTFDGAGYVLDNYKSVKSPYNAPNGKKISLVQDVSNITAGSVGTTYENEPSLFGYMNGLVKNLAITNAQFGQYGNIVLCGNGTIENFYLDVANLQATRYNNAGENLTAIVAPLLQRAYDSNVTMRNVVVDLADTAFSGTDATISTHYPSLIGPGLGKAENVAVYGFNTAWINAGGTRGNVYLDSDDVLSDGSAAGIYVEYADHTENGAIFRKVALDSDLWKVVTTVNEFDIPMLKNVNKDTTGSKPDGIDGTIETGADFNIVWGDSEVGAFDAMKFITETTANAVTDTKKKLVPAGFDSTLEANQIVVGTYETYESYVKDLLAANKYPRATTGAANYGVYKVGNTVFVLAESEEAFMYAAKEFCRQAYGWQQLSHTLVEEWTDTTVTYLDPDIYMNTGRSLADSIAAIKEGYTTQVAFTQRRASNGLYKTYDPNDFGSNNKTPYNDYVEMHNTLDYFSDNTQDATTKKWTKVWRTEFDFVKATDISGNVITDEKSNTAQICYLAHGNASNFTKMLERVESVIVTQAMADRNMTAINFMLEDNTYYCKCTACKAFSQPATPQLVFLNELAKTLRANEQLQAYNRTIDVEFFSYNAYSPAPTLNEDDITALNDLASSDSLGLGLDENLAPGEKYYTTAPVEYKGMDDYTVPSETFPATVLKAEDGLRLYWTSHEANHSFDLEHEANAHMYLGLLGWIASIGAENIDVFMYQAAYRDYFIPLNTWEYQLNWYKSLNKLGVNNHMFNLGNVYNAPNAQTGFAAFKSYIDSRAMTDINVTFKQLKDEFFGVNGYYGPAGPTMRTYFEELVSVYEGHKQGATNQFAAKSNEYTDVFFSKGGSYVAGWITQSIDGNYSTKYNVQAFFNGSYGWDMSAMVFGGVQTSRTKVTPREDLYVHSNHGTQQATLEQWYGYCQTALGKVSSDSTYADRINVEALFPEYASLVYGSTYSTNAKWDGNYGGYGTGTIKATLNSTSCFYQTDGTHYQDFYNKVIGLCVKQPSEFYQFDQADPFTKDLYGYTVFTGLGTTKYMTTVRQSGSSKYGLYQSFYLNWGVVSPKAY